MKLPEEHGEITVRVRIAPNAIHFTADLLDVTGGMAKIAYKASLGARHQISGGTSRSGAGRRTSVVSCSI
ncbi:MAG: hypothetical protein R3F40_02945 [Candidatus Competibacteraceae bacterium]